MRLIFSSLLIIGPIIANGLNVHHTFPSSSKKEFFQKEASPLSVSPLAVDYRLPTALVPIHYDVRIQPFINGNYSTNGHVDITFNVTEATSNVIFHIEDIVTINSTIKLVPENDPTGDGLEFVNHTYDPVTQFYTGALANPLAVGQIYIYSVDYNGYLNDINHGFYRSVYTEDGNDVFLAATQFESTDARRAYPCFDEPALKATFNITIAKQEGYGVISNMPNLSSTAISGQPGWTWENFNLTLPMSTYLTAVVVSDFVSLSSNENDHVLFRVWARKEAINQAEYALDLGPDVLTFYEQYFNIPFPLPKQDMAAIPDFAAGAMENWGLITYRESAFLFDPLISGASSKQRVGVVVAHELGHQWFGDLVSPAWWNYVWLNEGFAAYLENVGLNAVEPTFGMLEQVINVDVQHVFKADALESSHPINVEVNTPAEISQVFDDISYSKGASIIRMMNFFLTEDTFKQGLTNYLTALSYQAATQDDLWFYLTEQGHADGTLNPLVTVKQIMDTWTLQMGYPVLTLTRDNRGNAEISQDRFLLVRNPNSNDTHDYSWWVPISFTTQDNPDFTETSPKVWMSDVERSVNLTRLPATGQWVILNIQQTGYYRVNYDRNNWNAIAIQLRNDELKIHVINRAQVIDDSMNLARAGLLVYEAALDVASYLTRESALVPWYSAIDAFGYLDDMFARSSGYGALTNYFLTLTSPIYQNIGFDDSLDDPHQEQLLRAAILGTVCSLGDQPCVDSATALFNLWMANPDNETIISPNLKTIVYCNGIAEGDVEEWDFVWDQYLKSNSAAEKSRFLSGLGCTKVEWLLERYLELGHTDGGGIKKQDAYQVYNSVASNIYGRDIAWRYLETNWDYIAAYIGSYSECSDYTYTVSSTFNTAAELEDLLQLKTDHYASLGSATLTFDQAVENVNNNIEWMTNYYNEINQYLIDNGYGDGIGPSKLRSGLHKRVRTHGRMRTKGL